jgi:mono/diheme cytochrome c family protein
MTALLRLTASRALAAAGLALLPLWLAGQANAQPRLPAAPESPAAPRALARPPRTSPPASRASPAADAPSPGEDFYLRGMAPGGAPVPATLQGDIHVESSDMACVNCHRRSGMGTAEGPLVVPSIVGSILFAPVTKGAPQLGPPRTTGDGTRPAYTEAALLRAVRDGVDPSGRVLSATMPRYAIAEKDAKALAEFLRALGEGPVPGVGDAIVHLATIVTPGVTDARRASMLDVLRTFVRAKNGGTRYETRRRTRGPWDMEQQYQGYRDWVLDEWELRGAPGEWPAQLEELYRRQPVYAIVSGIAEEDWSPVDAFCSRHKVPAILPQTPLPPPVPSGDGFYSLYFSRGVVLEGQAIAHHLSSVAPAGGLRQVARCGTPGQAAAEALAGELSPAAAASTCVPPAAALTAEAWRALVGDARTLVLWLDAGDRAGLEALAGSPWIGSVSEVYLSSSLLGEEAVRLPEPLRARAVLVHPFVSPDEFDRHAVRSLMWMKANGITPPDRRVAVNAFFAIVLAADALNLPRRLGSREYFVETIEHMTNRSVYPTAYPSVSFDPRRRFASSGAYLLRVPSSLNGSFGKVEEWYVPES